jgi:hypothetical protein
VILFTGPMKEMPPALNATGGVVGVDWRVGVDDTCVADVVVGVVPVVLVVLVVDCPLLTLVPAHAVSIIIRTRTALHTNIP